MRDTSVFFTSCILVYYTIQDEILFFVILNSNRLVSISQQEKNMSFVKSMDPWEICEGQSHGYLSYLHKSLFFFGEKTSSRSISYPIDQADKVFGVV